MKWIKKATNIILIAVLAFSVVAVSLIPPPQQAHAIGPLIKVVGGEALDQIMQGLAYKAGQSFVDQDALSKARDRWNMEGYQKAQDYESKLTAEEKARFDKFYQEVNTKTITPNPSKPGWGKVVLSGAAFLVGLDLIYNAASSFQNGYSSGQPVEVAHYLDTHKYPGASVQIATKDNVAYATVSVVTTAGSETGEVTIWNYHEPGITYDFDVGYKQVDFYWNNGSFPPPGSYLPKATFRLKGEYVKPTNSDPAIVPIPATQSDGAISRLPEPFRNMGIVPGTTNVPDVAPAVAPQINPDTVIEIDVPLMPIPTPMPLEVEPITQEEWDIITSPDPKPNPDDETDPDKPPGTDPDGDPDKPPGTDPDGDPDAPPGTDPDGDTDAPPKEDEETPPGKDEEQPPKEEEENSCDASLKKPDFKKVGVAFTNAFPFSLPWDLKRFFDAAFAGIGSEKPSVDLTFLGDGVTVTIPDYFDSWIAVLKNIMVIMFDISLIWMFARFMQRGGGD